MNIVYASKTGNVRRFIEKLGMDNVQIHDSLVLSSPFILVTYTTGFGQVPESVIHFLKRNYQYLRAVAASGNKNWGYAYAKSADIIADLYEVPVLYKFELSGTQSDVHTFQERVKNFETSGIKQ